MLAPSRSITPSCSQSAGKPSRMQSSTMAATCSGRRKTSTRSTRSLAISAQDGEGLEELYDADEVFLTGTAAEIIGVSAIGDRTIGSGCMGPVSRKLEAEFRRRIQAGAPED